MTKLDLIVRSGSILIRAILLGGLLFVVMKAKADEPTALNAATKPAAPVEAKALSNILLASLEAKLKDLRQSQKLVQADSAASITFIAQRLEVLERMIRLMEQRQALQTNLTAYQQRLQDLARKMEKSAGAPRNIMTE